MAIMVGSRKESLSTINTLEQATALIEGFGLPVEKWVERRELPETERKIQENNDRYTEMMNRGAKQHRKLLQSPMDPILLIDGKYLLTGSVTGKTRDLFRMANWLIRSRIERSPRYEFEMESVKWGNDRQPRRGEIVRLKDKFPVEDTGKVDVEWLYTYVNEEGQLTDIQWLEKTLEEWRKDLAEHGIEVNLRRTPAAWTKGYGSTHQKQHQRVVVAWSRKEKYWQDSVHRHLKRWISREPHSMGTEAGRERAVHTDPILAWHWGRQRTSPEYEIDLAAVRAKVAGVEGTLNRYKDGRAIEDPVLVVNGEYVIEGGLSNGTVRALQILNWTVRKILKKGS